MVRDGATINPEEKIKTLSRKAFDASQEILETTARPLELARFRHTFLGESKDLVLNALDDFRNSDGGFGHALEPDLRTPDSSVLCTSIALQILRSLEVPREHAFVLSSMSFLMANFDRGQCGWRIIPETAEDSPRAPWWHQKGREEQFTTFSLNPTAEILGYLLDHRERVSEIVIAMVLERVFCELKNFDQIEMHDLLCCLRLFQTTALPKNYRDQLYTKLSELSNGTVARDPKQWQDYSLRPLQIVDTPESPFITKLQDSVAANLDYEIDSQNADGSWTPTWSWGEAFPETWVKAKNEWSGVITLDKLLILQRFGRIENA